MEATDRAPATGRLTNAIQFLAEPAERSSQSLHGASPGPVSEAGTAVVPPRPTQSVQTGKRPADFVEPASISKSYHVEDKEGERRYFDDAQRSTLVIRVTGTAVRSSRDDVDTIRAMFDIAQARGWDTIDIRGSAKFKRDAGIEATSRGLEARGLVRSDSKHRETKPRRVRRKLANQEHAQEAPTPAVAMKASAIEAKVANTPVPATARRAQSQREPASMSPGAKENHQAKLALTEPRKALATAKEDLSPDGRLILAALSEKIDRQMDRHNAQAKSDLKAFVVTELAKKERAEGPIVLSVDQKRLATAPEPQLLTRRSEPPPDADWRHEPDAPRRILSR
jgi:hypothetical protein